MKILDNSKKSIIFALAKQILAVRMAHGVTGNTSVFGTEESRFEP